MQIATCSPPSESSTQTAIDSTPGRLSSVAIDQPLSRTTANAANRSSTVWGALGDGGSSGAVYRARAAASSDLASIARPVYQQNAGRRSPGDVPTRNGLLPGRLLGPRTQVPSALAILPVGPGGLTMR